MIKNGHGFLLGEINMKCPHILTVIARETVVLKVHREPSSLPEEADDIFIYWEPTIVTHHVFSECLQEQCGAWHKGRCTKGVPTIELNELIESELGEEEEQS